MDIDGGTAGMTVASRRLGRVFTIDGATTSISVSLNALTITGGDNVNRGGGVRVFDGTRSRSRTVSGRKRRQQLGDAIGVESGATATLINTTVAKNGTGSTPMPCSPRAKLTMIKSP